MNGGQAFPGEFITEGGSRLPGPGMTMLDYFAAAALTGYLTRGLPPRDEVDLMADSCYWIAAAMIARKDKR